MLNLKNIFSSDEQLLIKHGDKFPREIKEYCLHPDIGKQYFCDDKYTPWEKGKEWLYQETIKHQPKTGQLLLDSDNFFVTARKKRIGSITGYNLNLYQEVNGKTLQIDRGILDHNPSDDGYKTWINKTADSLTKRNGKPTQLEERYLSLPTPIRMAYYYRFDGFQYPCDPTSPDISMGVLPAHSSSSWYSIDRFLGALRLKKKYIPWFEERIPGIKPENNDDSYTNFMCFLDTRTDDPRKGDVFFVKNHIQDGVIYHIKDTDIENMKILSDPKTAIDLYCEHTLLKKPGRFDFSPYTSDFE